MTSIRTTPTHVYFWGSLYSNFYRRTNTRLFSLPLWRGGPAVDFHHSEGYYMAMKAMAFGATTGQLSGTKWRASLLEQIIAERDPKTAKSFGRAIPGFSDAIWTPQAKTHMFRGIWAKFSQNADLARTLLETGDRKLVEGSPHDRIWGVGLAWDDHAIEDERNWTGTNYLGELLMMVRSLIAGLDVDEVRALDPFLVPIN